MIAAILTLHLLTGAAPAEAKELEDPGVNYRVAVAGATAAPWVTANGWRFVRNPETAFVSHATGPALSLAMAEAFAWGGNVWFQVAEADRSLFDQTMAFLEALPRFSVARRVQIGVDEDGTDDAGEVLKLLARRNLMAAPMRKSVAPELVVKLGTAEYSRESAKNPAQFAATVRTRLGDERRLLRIYGSDTVLGELEGDAARTRVHMVNYANRDVNGVRVRVLGVFREVKVAALGQPELVLRDVAVSEGGTEFTLPILTRYAVVDLAR